jgi:nucleobase:cation symporter-1, NCS1 family
LSAPSDLHVESHSIDFVPLTERYGTPARLFTIWFSINLSIVCAAVGTLGPAAGLPLGWTVLAITIGNALGTAIMAGHSAQGPHLGVPQMIQSRAQFGVLGAALPLIAVVITYTLYTAADGLLVEGPIGSLLGCSNSVALVLFGLLTILIAYIGYELIHRLGAVLAVTSGLLFVVAAVLYVRNGLPPMATPPPVPTHYSGAVFMLVITQAAAWSLSFGPYVADYSRYLPATVAPSTTFWTTALGCFIGTTLVMAFGAYLASLSPALGTDLGGAVAAVFGALRPVALVLVVLSVLQGNVMNLYSAYMSTVTIYSGVHSMQRIGRRSKLVLLFVLTAAATGIALWAQDSFQTYFADILSVMIYLLVPWSAINLVDYYVVRKGEYTIADLFTTTGQYGAVRWDTMAIYLVGMLVQVPFMSLSVYSGPIARALGADLAWLPGLLIPGVVFVLTERRRLRR